MMPAEDVKRKTGDRTDDVRGKTMFFFGVVGMLLFGWIAFPFLLYKSFAQPVQFSHRIHTGDDLGLSCSDCHTYDEDGRFRRTPSIAKCAECHSNRISVSAEECNFVTNYIATGKEVHWLIYSRQPENVYFSHATHVRLAGIDCQACHFGQSYTDKLRPARFSRISGYSLDVFGRTLFGVPSTPSPGSRRPAQRGATCPPWRRTAAETHRPDMPPERPGPSHASNPLGR